MAQSTHKQDGRHPSDLLAAVPGHPGWQASSDGHIYTRSGSRVKEHRKEAGENRLRVSCQQHGYHYVAKLIALSFLGLDAETHAVVHRNGNPADDRLSNLRLVRNAGANANCTRKRLLNVHERSLPHRYIREGMAQTNIAVELDISTRCVRYHSGSCHCPNTIRNGEAARMLLGPHRAQ